MRSSPPWSPQVASRESGKAALSRCGQQVRCLQLRAAWEDVFPAWFLQAFTFLPQLAASSWPTSALFSVEPAAVLSRACRPALASARVRRRKCSARCLVTVLHYLTWLLEHVAFPGPFSAVLTSSRLSPLLSSLYRCEFRPLWLELPTSCHRERSEDLTGPPAT